MQRLLPYRRIRKATIVKFSLQTGQQNIEWTELSETWQRIEELGYDGCWTIDHFLPTGTRDVDGPCMDGWAVLAALAAETKKLRLGTLVTGNLFRNPALLAKTATTIDHISNGRLEFGIGAGNNSREHQAYGWAFPAARERLDRLDEALHVIRMLWSGEKEVNFDGKYYQLQNAPFLPAPIQRPHPPIMIGGGGERRTLRLVAQHADVWNGIGTLSELSHKIKVLQTHCNDVGRRFEEIRLTAGTPLIPTAIYERWTERNAERRAISIDELRSQTIGGTAEYMRSAVQAYSDAGFTELILMMNTPYDWDTIERFAKEVAPEFR